MSRWLYEEGIGEERAALVEAGAIVEARIVPEDRRHLAGAIVAGRVAALANDGRRAHVTLADGTVAMARALPAGITEGSAVAATIVREALVESGGPYGQTRIKPMRVEILSEPAEPRPAPRLIEQLEGGSIPVARCLSHGRDLMAEAGWNEIGEQALSGIVPFAGGTLTLAMTPAMTVIDVDGSLPPRPLALAAAPAFAAAIRRLGLNGSIVIDFPTLPDKAGRQAIAEAFDAAMALPCERTQVNGFGLMQVVLRRTGPSLVERAIADPARRALLDVLRSAERLDASGPIRLLLTPEAAKIFDRHPAWRTELERRTGRPVAADIDPSLELAAMSARSGA